MNFVILSCERKTNADRSLTPLTQLSMNAFHVSLVRVAMEVVAPHILGDAYASWSEDKKMAFAVINSKLILAMNSGKETSVSDITEGVIGAFTTIKENPESDAEINGIVKGCNGNLELLDAITTVAVLMHTA